jgi:hypothetical protein
MVDKIRAPEWAKQLFIEATFKSNQKPDTFIYGLVTYDKSKPKGLQLDKIQKYNIQAHGKIPINENELLDMVLNTDKNDRMLDFHMLYRKIFTDSDESPLGVEFKGRAHSVNIRTDYGHGITYPHTDIEIFDKNDKKRKIFDHNVDQDHGFPNYEAAISATFMQVEKLANPLIGAQYWLSPTQIYPERVQRLAATWKEQNIQTSLSILSRLINNSTYEQTSMGETIDEEKFWKIAESQLKLVREKETELGGELNIEIQYSTEMSVLPFLFFVPEHAVYSFKTYHSDGSEVNHVWEPLGTISERRNGVSLIHKLDGEQMK